MNKKKAVQIPIHRVLSYWQVKPEKYVGDDVWYKSPFRPTEKTASFKINRIKNLWYDHGAGQGGNVIDLVMVYESCSFQTALLHLENMSGSTTFKTHSLPVHTSGVSKKNPSVNYTIKRVQSLENKALVAYLEDRKIPYRLAKKYLKEIYFTQKQKQFFALAFGNDQNGYEVRNKYFKGCLGSKAITYFPASSENANTLSIFEGCIDFLSYLTLLGVDTLDGHVIVLNSIALKDKALAKIKAIDPVKIDGFLDNDEAGIVTAQFFRENSEMFTAWSDRFLPHKDINDYLCNVNK